ncbi:hypothetical protein VQH23_07485 [Pararoseomonas sp. SCSIO 73927]|uniref:hypothetical protein n=1 Tax=Pararoseomonas sp. SCSIO 73927 TaxID=3114537 RepID=UPI0030D627DF
MADLVPDFSWRDLGGLTMFALAVGTVIGFVVRAWLRQNLAGVFVEHSDLNRVQASVDGVKADVGSVKTDVAQLTARTVELEELVHTLPTKEDVKTIRHDVKDLLQQNAALGATVKGHSELLEGIDRRQEILLQTLLQGGSRA